jgi:hypothetical protein
VVSRPKSVSSTKAEEPQYGTWHLQQRLSARRQRTAPATDPHRWRLHQPVWNLLPDTKGTGRAQLDARPPSRVLPSLTEDAATVPHRADGSQPAGSNPQPAAETSYPRSGVLVVPTTLTAATTAAAAAAIIPLPPPPCALFRPSPTSPVAASPRASRLRPQSAVPLVMRSLPASMEQHEQPHQRELRQVRTPPLVSRRGSHGIHRGAVFRNSSLSHNLHRRVS